MQENEWSDKFAMMWKSSREDSGKSQEYVAKKLGISKRTVQNWESGYSCPSQIMGLRWFQAIGLQPLPYYLKLLYGEFAEISPKSADKMIENALIERIKTCSPSEKRKLLFILYGDHGSSSHGIIEMVTAHLHVPLKDRLNVAQEIILNYEIAEMHDNLVKSEHVLPDIDFLKQSFKSARESVIDHKNSYVNVKE